MAPLHRAINEDDNLKIVQELLVKCPKDKIFDLLINKDNIVACPRCIGPFNKVL